MINNNGFTLIELVIVLLISGIIMAIGIQRYSYVQKSIEINDDMHDISSFLKSKRLTAFTVKNEIEIKVDATGKTITATKDPSGTAVADGSISLNYAVAPASSTFTINSRGLFSTLGNIHLATVNTATTYSCVLIASARIRLGEWDGTNCIAK
jgi:prepilin-type N-terminal cleavage/methylation domain-containing protein